MSEQLKNIIAHEGWRLNPYKDTEGYLTGGAGHKMLDEDISSFNYNWSDDEKTKYWTKHLEQDYAKAKVSALEDIGAADVTPEQLEIITEMNFNLGDNGFSRKEWPEFFKALDAGDKELAANELMNSKWSKQVKGRAKALSDRLRNT